MVTAYGLIGDTIIGSLIMSEKMKVKNEGSTITLDKDGITILNEEETDPDKKVVFHAGIDGSLVVSNYVSDEQLSAQLSIRDGEIESLVSDIYENDGTTVKWISKINQTADEIRTEVEETIYGEDGVVETLSGSITVQADRITSCVSRISQNETDIGNLEVESDRIDSKVTKIIDLDDDDFVENLESEIEQTAKSISLKVGQSYTLGNLVNDMDAAKSSISSLSSDIDLIPGQITATVTAAVSNKVDAMGYKPLVSKFGWQIGFDSDGKGHFKVISNNIAVLDVNDNGLSVAGKVTAESGYIGNGEEGFTITNKSIYNTKSSYTAPGDGVYIGTNGIALGNTFKVSDTGDITINNLYGTNAELHGTFYNSGTNYSQEIAEGYHRFYVSSNEYFNISPQQLYWHWYYFGVEYEAKIERSGSVLRFEGDIAGPWDDISPVAVFG